MTLLEGKMQTKLQEKIRELENVRVTLGDLLREARTEAGLDQAAIAEACGVSRPLVSKWERGISVPSVVEFATIVKVTDAEWLCDLRKLPSPCTPISPGQQRFSDN